MHRIYYFIGIFLCCVSLFVVDCNRTSKQDEWTLKNGLRVVFYYRNSPITSAVFIVGVGEANHPRQLVTLTNEMLLRGTEVRNAQQMHQEIELWGGRLGTETALTTSLIHLQAPEQTFLKCFPLLCECVTRPSFEEGEFLRATLKKVTDLDDENALFSRKGFFSDVGLRSLLFHSSPLDLAGQSDRTSFSLQDVQDLFSTWYHPSNMVLVVTGHFDRSGVSKIVDQSWMIEGKNTPSTKPDFRLGEIADPPEKTVTVKKQFDRLWIGFRSPGLLSEHFFAACLLEKAMASGRSSSLTDWLIQRGCAEFKTTSYYHFDVPYGYFAVVVETPSGRGSEAKTMILEKLEQIKTNGISENEFEIAKRKLISESAIRFQFSLDCSIFLGFLTFSNSPFRTIASFEKGIEQLTLADVNQTAAVLFSNPVVWYAKSQ